jgi:hypothetical protein
MMRASVICLAVAVVGLAPVAAHADRLEPAWTFTTGSNPGVVGPSSPGGPSIVIQGHSGEGTPDIVAATFHTFSNSPTPTNISPTPFSEALFITADGHTEKATFDFLLTGSISSTAAYLGVVPTGRTTETVHLDHHYFDITVNPFQTPGKPSDLGGWLTFEVKVHPNPEPSTLVLASIGLALLARRRRQPK